MLTLNLGILAHVDAGKTSLTERLLYLGGVIDAPGSVDAGSTRTDSLALERRRGITIRTAVAGFRFDRDVSSGGPVAVNLIDTPGHPDFIAEVERALRVLDGAVLVISAVEGVQAQTRILMRALQRLRIPTVIFVNKVDRGGARYQGVLAEIVEKLSPTALPVSTVDGIGTRAVEVQPRELGDPDFVSGLEALLADQHGTLLDLAVPVWFGSAITGAGVTDLLRGVVDLLTPSPSTRTAEPFSGRVFAVQRADAGELVAYLRVDAGTLAVRDRIPIVNREAKVTAIGVSDGPPDRHDAVLSAGQIGRVRGLGDVRIGDVIGAAAQGIPPDHRFAPPTLATVVTPSEPARRPELYSALTRMAEQDPLIDLQQDDARGELTLALYGEVQKEVIGQTLAEEHGIDVTFGDTSVICVERLTGSGTAEEAIRGEDNPFLATVGLRVDPAPIGAGITFGLEIELGALPMAFLRAIEETVRATLHQGLAGWQIPDCAVTLVRSGYWPRQSHAHATFDKSMSSTAGDFRLLTPLVLMTAVRRAGTVVREPIHRFRLEVPTDLLGAVLPAVSRLRAVPLTSELQGAATVLEGDVPAARVHAVQQLLPSLTRGEGLLETTFDHHQDVTGVPPRRARTDANPLHRRAYLLRVTRQV